MGIDLADITEAMRAPMCPSDRKALGKRGLTNAEARDKYCTRTERAIHGQFSGFWAWRRAVKPRLCKVLPHKTCFVIQNFRAIMSCVRERENQKTR